MVTMERTSDPAAGPTPRAAIYIRVSTDQQERDGYSLKAQAQDCHRLADELGAEITAIYQDVHTGTDWNLPGLNSLLDAAERGDIDLVLCNDIDRLARGMAKQLVLEEQLRKAGVQVRYVRLRLGDTAEDRLLKNVRASIAEYERELIIFRTTRGRRAKAERGFIVGTGSPPYGYQFAYSEGPDGRPHITGLKIDPATAPVVRRIFQALTHQSLGALCDQLNAEGIPTRRIGPGGWAPGTVKRLINNPAYVGTATYGRHHYTRLVDPAQWVLIPVPPLVDEETQQAALDALSRRRNAGQRAGSFGGRPRSAGGAEDAARYPLRGMLLCGHCGGRLACKNNNGFRYYHCTRSEPRLAERARRPVCGLRDVLAADLDAYTWEMISGTLLDAENLAQGLDAARQQNEASTQRRRQQIEIIDRESARTSQRLDRAMEELLDVERGSERAAKLRHDAREMEATIKRLHTERTALEAMPAPGLNPTHLAALEAFAEEIRAGLAEATPAQRRELYSLLQLQGRVSLDPERGRPFGHHYRYCIEWEAVIRLRHGVNDHSQVLVSWLSGMADSWEARPA